METRYKDTGCELNPTCLDCPYPTKDCPPYSPGSERKLPTTRFIHIGFGNLIDQTRITEVTRIAYGNSLQVERLSMVERTGFLITMTKGRRIQSVIQMDSGHFILSYLTPEQLQERLAVV